MDKENFFNPNLESRLLRLEEKFKKNNPLGYQQRKALLKDVIKEKHKDDKIYEEESDEEESDNTFIRHNIFNKSDKINFVITIGKNKWLLHDANKEKSDAFHANDITRLQYIEAARIGKFMGYLPKHIILGGIANKDTLNILNPISNEDLKEVFPTTIHGKRIKYLFNDLSLTIKSINFKREANGDWDKHTITIDTNMLPD